MKTLVVVGHPDLAHSVVNRAWVDGLRECESSSLEVHILAEELRPDRTFDVEYEQRLLCENDRIILQFPLYWYMVPGIMKEWMDQVWCEGFCYGEEGVALEGKLLEAATSCGAPEFVFDASKGYTSLDTYLSFLSGIAAFVRARPGRIFSFFGTGSPGYEERLAQSVRDYQAFVRTIPADDRRG